MNKEKEKALFEIAISYKTTPFKKLRAQCQAFAVKQCNENVSEKYIKDRTNFLEARAKNLLKISYIPKWLELYGDPRGFVAYIKGDEIDEKAKSILRDYGVDRDWGGNYSIGSLTK